MSIARSAVSIAQTLGIFCVSTAVIFAVLVLVASKIDFAREPLVERIVPIQEPGGPSHSLVRFREVEQVGEVDMVFLGASHTYRGFDPRMFSERGISTMNLGSTSQTPLNTLYLLRRYLEELQPKVVVYEIYQTVFGIDGMESYYDLLSNTSIDMESVQMALSVRQPQAWTALLATAFRNRSTPLSDYEQVGRDGHDDLYVEGGYVQTTSVFPKERLEALRQGVNEPSNYEMNPHQFAFLRSCIELCAEQGVRFIACSYPIPVETRSQLIDFDLKQKEIESFFVAEGVAFRDFNRTMTLDTATCYYDEVHLNQRGVEKFNDAFLDWLAGLE